MAHSLGQWAVLQTGLVHNGTCQWVSHVNEKAELGKQLSRKHAQQHKANARQTQGSSKHSVAKHTVKAARTDFGVAEEIGNIQRSGSERDHNNGVLGSLSDASDQLSLA